MSRSTRTRTVSTARVREYLRSHGVRAEGPDEEVLERAKAFRAVSTVPDAEILRGTLRRGARALGVAQVEALRDKHMRRMRKLLKGVRIVQRRGGRGRAAPEGDAGSADEALAADVAAVLSDGEVVAAMRARQRAIEEMIERIDTEGERERQVELERIDGAVNLQSDATWYLVQHMVRCDVPSHRAVRWGRMS